MTAGSGCASVSVRSTTDSAHGSTAAILPQPVEADVAEYPPHPSRESRRLLQSLELAERLQECVLEGIPGILLGTQVTQRLQVEAVLMADHEGIEGGKAAGKGRGDELGICGLAFHRSTTTTPHDPGR